MDILFHLKTLVDNESYLSFARVNRVWKKAWHTSPTTTRCPVRETSVDMLHECLDNGLSKSNL